MRPCKLYSQIIIILGCVGNHMTREYCDHVLNFMHEREAWTQIMLYRCNSHDVTLTVVNNYDCVM